MDSRHYGVLIVDDEACMRAVLNVGMQQQGFTAFVAANGREAIDLYRRHHDSIDVALLDVRMPDLDGPHTLMALQRLNPKICCCFMSGDLGRYTEGQLHSLGAVGFIRKPFCLGETAQRLWDLATTVDAIEDVNILETGHVPEWDPCAVSIEAASVPSTRSARGAFGRKLPESENTGKQP